MIILIHPFIRKIASLPRPIGVFIAAVIYVLAYGLTNHHALWGPWLMPTLGVENMIPFIPWTVAIYVSVYIQILSAFFLLPKTDFALSFRTGLLIVLFHATIFLLFPTFLPRTALPPIAPGFSHWLYYTFVTSFDSPQNCFPSLHVSMALFISFVIWHARRKASVVYFIWAILIALSTLTLKQHYLLDIIGGAVVAVVAYHLTFSQWPFRQDPHLIMLK